MKARVIFLSAFLLAACASAPQGEEIILVSPAGETHSFFIERAETAEVRAQGLMNRTELSEDAGMLFVMDTEETLQFWMKNTLIPLDIIFFTGEGLYVSSATMEPCQADPCPMTFYEEHAKYALEVAAGTAEKLRIGEGWTLGVGN